MFPYKNRDYISPLAKVGVWVRPAAAVPALTVRPRHPPRKKSPFLICGCKVLRQEMARLPMARVGRGPERCCDIAAMTEIMAFGFMANLGHHLPPGSRVIFHMAHFRAAWPVQGWNVHRFNPSTPHTHRRGGDGTSPDVRDACSVSLRSFLTHAGRNPTNFF